MRLTTLSDPILLLEQHLRQGREILRESCNGLTKEQQFVVETVYKEFIPLIEASLTVDQIKQVFGAIEKTSIEGGQSRTLAGKSLDVAKKANEIIDQLGAKVQDTAPVKAFDQKFEQLKSKVAEKFPDLAQKTASLGSWVKENPGKSALVIGILTALASLAGGPVGGAIAGQVLRGAQELLKGEKLSTAIGKGIKTAALGYLSGKAFEMLGKFVGSMRAEALPIPGAQESGLEQVSWGASKTLSGPGMEWKQTTQGFDVIVFPEEKAAIEEAMRMIRDGQAGGFDTLQTIAREIRSADYKSAIKDIMANARSEQLANDGLSQWINGMSQAGQALSQGAVAAAGAMPKKESLYVQTRPLSEGQVYMLFDRVLTEAGFLDKIKTGVGKAAGAVASGASWLGKQATEKITSAKLTAAWKMAGSPTDSAELQTFLQSQGVNKDTVDKVYADLKLSTEAESKAANKEIEPIQKQILALPDDQRQEMIAYLQKQLKVA